MTASVLRLLVVIASAGTLVTTSRAQSICFAPGAASYSSGGSPSDLRLVDVDGDAVLDIVTVRQFGSSQTWLRGLSDGTFGPAMTSPFNGTPASLVDLDVDGDGDLDLAVARSYSHSDVAILTNDGSGSFSETAAYPTGLTPVDIAKADLDHDGDEDLIVATYAINAVDVLRNLGNGTFAPATHSGIQQFPVSLAVADMNGDGHADVVVGMRSATGSGFPSYLAVLLNFGPGTLIYAGVQYPTGTFGTAGVAAGDVDGDGDQDALAACGGSPFLVRLFRNNGLGHFPSPHVDIPVSGVPSDVALLDAEADGDLDLFVSTDSGVHLFVNDGSGGYSLHHSFAAPGAGLLAIGELNGDGHHDLTWLQSVVRVRLNCGTNGIPFCFGDVSGTACPCGNASAIGAQAGCLHSFGTAGELVSTGTPSVSADTVTLLGSGMTNGQALYFQGVSLVNGGAGASFGDGLRCVGGTTVRLGTKVNAGGASQYPAAGDVPVSVKGGVAAGATRYYQVLYRNIAPFCTGATYNLTNGLRLTWSP